MSIYRNERTNKRASKECLKYMLNKHRDCLMKEENERRAELRGKQK